MTQTIKSQKWVRAYCQRLLCEALDGGHPMHPHNQALAQGVDPTAFGIEDVGDVDSIEWSSNEDSN